MKELLTPEACLPEDGTAGTLVGRAWIPAGELSSVPGPGVVALTADGVRDISKTVATMSDLLNAADPVATVERALETAPIIGTIPALLANSDPLARDESAPWFLAPTDLSANKASGVTFVRSMLERVIEERARGDADQAVAARGKITEVLGDDLAAIVPGSEQAAKIKAVLIEQGMWSQYLEVGIGPDAEIFTKAPPMSAVGLGADVGVLPSSTWNNPEPEIVLAVSASGRTVGAALGNDVNLRDIEGRSALLLGKAKDNNASCAIGPFIRLFDSSFSIDDVRKAVIGLTVQGADNYRLEGSSSMAEISRDPLDLVAQAIGPNHQYPDGLMLFLGTMFAPIEDRSEPGRGFTHKLGDVVTISTPKLGALINRVTRTDQAAPWVFGATALMRNLAARGLL